MKLRTLIANTANVAVGTGFVAGVPLALWALVGNPLPSTVPTLERFQWHLANGQIPDRFWIGALAVVVWVAWAQLVVAVIVEAAAALRGVQTPTLRGFGWAQRLAGPVVARAAMAAAVLTTSPAMAAPVGALAPLELGPDATTEPVFTETSAVQADGAATTAGSVSDVTVTVGQRDSLRSIAADRLGDPERWPELRAANVGRTMSDGSVFAPDQTILHPGWVLALPATTTPSAGPSETQRSVDVVDHDHFWSLAEQQLTEAWGRAPTDEELTPYWAAMVEANADRLLPPGDPNLIYPGQTFVVPDTPLNPDHGPSVAASAAEPLQFTIVETAAKPAPPAEPAPRAETEPVPDPSPEPARNQAPAAPAPPVNPLSQPDAEPRVELPDRSTLATVGVTAFTAGLAVVGLRTWRRRRIARTAAPVAAPGPTTGTLTTVEDQIRALADDGEAARYIAAFNPWLSHLLSDWPHRLPALVAAKAGRNGLEVLLEEPTVMPDKFTPIADDGRAWRLTSDVSDRQMEHDARTSVPYAPMLCPFGDTPTGELLVDVEQLGSVTVTGPGADDYLRTLAVNLLAAPWAHGVEIVAIGVPDIRPAQGSRVTVPADPTMWARQAVTRAQQGSGAPMSTYEHRTKGMLIDSTAQVVLVGSEYTAVAQHLAAAAAVANRQFALIAATELPTEHRFVIAGRTAKLEPFGLECDVHLVDRYDLGVIDDLTADALAPPEPAADDGTDDVVEVAAEPVTRAEPSTETLTRIGGITAPNSIEVNVLGPKPTVTGAELTPQQLALTAYMALNPKTTMTQVRDTFWGPDKKQVAWNAISKLRRQLGDDPATSQPRLPKTDEVTLIDVGTDWARFCQLVDHANNETEPADTAAYLDAALELVTGRPGTHAAGRMWQWFTDDRAWYETIDTAIVAAAKHRADIGLNTGDLVAARHAVRCGQHAVGTDNEALLMASMQITKHLEGDRALDNEMTSAIAEADRNDYDLDPRIHRLYETLRTQTNLEAVHLQG